MTIHKRVLFMNSGPHGTIEEEFWRNVTSLLGEQGIQLCMHPIRRLDSAIPQIFASGLWGEVNFEEDATLSDQFFQRLQCWGKSGDTQAYRRVQRDLCELLFLVKPDLVLFWNGERAEQIFLKSVLNLVKCPYRVIERTPWPGLVSLDSKGILGNCKFLREPVQWRTESESQKWLSLYNEYEESMRTSDRTWWEQPRSPATLNLPTDKPVVLFAGQVDQDTQNFLFSPHFDNNLDAFKWFVKCVRTSSNAYILGKQHPKSRTPPSAYKESLESSYGEWREDIPLNSALKRADGVVAVNSSVLCEAIIHRKPALALGETMFSSLDVIPQITNVNDDTTVSRWLLQIGSKTPLYSDQLVSRWNHFCSWHLARHLYTMNLDGPIGSERGAQQMVEAISTSITNSPRVEWDPLFPLRSIADWTSRLSNLQSIGAEATRRIDKLTNIPGVKMLMKARLNILQRLARARQD